MILNSFSPARYASSIAVRKYRHHHHRTLLDAAAALLRAVVVQLHDGDLGVSLEYPGMVEITKSFPKAHSF